MILYPSDWMWQYYSNDTAKLKSLLVQWPCFHLVPATFLSVLMATSVASAVRVSGCSERYRSLRTFGCQYQVKVRNHGGIVNVTDVVYAGQLDWRWLKLVWDFVLNPLPVRLLWSPMLTRIRPATSRWSRGPASASRLWNTEKAKDRKDKDFQNETDDLLTPKLGWSI